LPLSIAP